MESLNSLKKKVEEKDAAILAHVSVDTVKVVEDGKIIKTVDRKKIYLAETPQGFKSELIKKCYEECDNREFTDEASLVESMNYDVYIVENVHNNQKMTYEEDFKND